MVNVQWEWRLLSTTYGSSSHRVARRGTSATTPPANPNHSGIDGATPALSGWSWTPSRSAEAPATLQDGSGRSYVFAFWSVQGGTNGGNPVGSSLSPSPRGFSVPVGSDGNAQAVAHYVWDFGNGGGGNAVYIDAFDQDTGFFPEDFVNVSPEDGKSHSDPQSLYWKANDGYLNTDTDVTQNETITAFDVGQRKFKYWLEVTALTFPSPNGPGVQGTDLSIMPACRMVAFAVYGTVATGPVLPPNIERGTRVWVSHGVMIDGPGIIIGPGGVEPVGPWNPWFQNPSRFSSYARGPSISVRPNPTRTRTGGEIVTRLEKRDGERESQKRKGGR